MKTPKKKLDIESEKNPEDSIAGKRLIDDEDDEFDAPLEELGGIEDLDTFEDEDDDF